jgi:hypothetical protein
MRTSHGANQPAHSARPRHRPRTLHRPRPLRRRRPLHRHRAPRRRTGAAVLLAAAVALVLSGPVAPGAAAFAATDEPTISFLGDGPAPLACSSTPSVPNMTVKQNTRVVLANFTGADATAAIGDGRTVPVADGTAISVKLKPGTYLITMTPNCLDTYDIGATVITVVRSEDAPPPTSTPTPPEATGPAVPPVPGDPGAGQGAASSSPSGSFWPSSQWTSSPPSSAPGALAGGAAPSGPGPADADASDPDVRAALAVPPSGNPDRRGDRLLALIAAICVFGVTSAIIRAIVAQRATGALGI